MKIKAKKTNKIKTYWFLLIVISFVVYLLIYPILILFDSQSSDRLALSFVKTESSPNSYITAITFDPTNSQIMYVGTEENGVFKSLDGGNSWQSASKGLPQHLVGTSDKRMIYGAIIALDVVSSNQLYAKVDSYFRINTNQPEYFVSHDGGLNWAQTQTNVFSDFPLSMPDLRKIINDNLAITTSSDNASYLTTYDKIYYNSGQEQELVFGSKANALAKSKLGLFFLPAMAVYFFAQYAIPSGSLLGYTGVGFGSFFTTPLVFSPSNPQTVYVGTSKGLMKGIISEQ